MSHWSMVPVVADHGYFVLIDDRYTSQDEVEKLFPMAQIPSRGPTNGTHMEVIVLVYRI